MADMQDAVHRHLTTRRSVLARNMIDPGPDGAALDRILTIAARVPDHGKLSPWRFIVLAGNARAAFADLVIKRLRQRDDAVDTARAENERARFTAPPLTIVVVSAPRAHPKVPQSEQFLSAGAVCLNLLHGAHAEGFAGQWLTGWPAFDADILAALGIREGESIAGFISIGSAAATPEERGRPDIAALTERWSVPTAG